MFENRGVRFNDPSIDKPLRGEKILRKQSDPLCDDPLCREIDETNITLRTVTLSIILILEKNSKQNFSPEFPESLHFLVKHRVSRINTFATMIVIHYRDKQACLHVASGIKDREESTAPSKSRVSPGYCMQIGIAVE